jgi:hypothetical protein
LNEIVPLLQLRLQLLLRGLQSVDGSLQQLRLLSITRQFHNDKCEHRLTLIRSRVSR